MAIMDQSGQEEVKVYNEVSEKDCKVIEISFGNNENNGVRKIQAINFDQNCYNIKCPFCEQESATKIVKRPSKCFYLTCIPLSLIPPLCLIPYFMSSCYDKLHFCTSCGRKIGCYKSFSHPAQANNI